MLCIYVYTVYTNQKGLEQFQILSNQLHSERISLKILESHAENELLELENLPWFWTTAPSKTFTSCWCKLW